jgi:hypothetical protein
MRKSIGALLAAAAMIALPITADARPRLDPEAKLAKILAGRDAGEPVHCIHTPSIRKVQIIEKTAIVYDAGNVIYVNRPASGASSLRNDDVLVTKLTIPQLCNVDIVHLRDRGLGFPTGTVGLGDFVPYRKVGWGH